MNPVKSIQNSDLKEISFSELNAIKGGTAFAMAGLIFGGIKFALEASYYLGYGVGYYTASNE
jgi:hypothetical protein